MPGMNCIQPTAPADGHVDVGAEAGLDHVDRREHLQLTPWRMPACEVDGLEGGELAGAGRRRAGGVGQVAGRGLEQHARALAERQIGQRGDHLARPFDAGGLGDGGAALQAQHRAGGRPARSRGRPARRWRRCPVRAAARGGRRARWRAPGCAAPPGGAGGARGDRTRISGGSDQRDAAGSLTAATCARGAGRPMAAGGGVGRWATGTPTVIGRGPPLVQSPVRRYCTRPTATGRPGSSHASIETSATASVRPARSARPMTR